MRQTTVLDSPTPLSNGLESLTWEGEVVETAVSRERVGYFLSKFAWILNRNTGKKVKWEPWPYLLDLLDILQEYPDIIIVKARQLGISWLLAGYAVWKAVFGDAVLGLLLSQGEKDAWKLLRKCKYIYRNLPDFLSRGEKHPDNREFFDINGSDSQLEAMPSTEKAGRGTDATLIIRDEAAFHPYAKENYSAIRPAIDSGGQGVDLSTVYKFDLENHFRERVNKALDGATKRVYPSGLELYSGGSSGAAVVFLGWRLRPVRKEGITLEEWFLTNVKLKYSQAEVDAEYPETLEQALAYPEHSCRFDIKILREMASKARDPLRKEGMIRIYREPLVQERYILAVDPSEGTYDPCAGIVIEWRSAEKVADFSGKISLQEQLHIIKKLNEMYNSPFVGIERNAAGLHICEQIVKPEMGITNIYYGKPNKPGWWTSSQTRPILITELAEAVLNWQIIEPSMDSLNQFMSFQRTEKNKDGEAIGGAHDEFPMCWGIAWQLRKVMPIKTPPLISVQMTERW